MVHREALPFTPPLVDAVYAMVVAPLLCVFAVGIVVPIATGESGRLGAA